MVPGRWAQGQDHSAGPTRKPLVLGGPSACTEMGQVLILSLIFCNFLTLFGVHTLLSSSCFFATRGLRCCMWAALRPQCMGSALRRHLPPLLFSRSSLVKALGHAGPRSCSTRSQQLQLLGLAAPQRAQSSQTRDQTRVPCIGRWSLIHWTAREVPSLYFQMLPHPGALGTYGDSPLRAN